MRVVDQRFLDECVDEEISMGDFVLTGGEIPAMAVCDAVCRMVPGVLPDEECFQEESHWNGLLEYPQYSRPAVWHDRAVPEILLSGDHGKVAAWRKKESYKRTMARRPDLFSKFDESQLTTKAEKKNSGGGQGGVCRRTGGTRHTDGGLTIFPIKKN